MGCKVNQIINPFGFVGARVANGVLKNDTDIQLCSVFPEIITSPTNLIATAISSDEIDLSWVYIGDIGKVNGFQIERSENNIDWTAINVVANNITDYSDNGLAADTEYYYRIIALAVLPDIDSSPSNVDSDYTFILVEFITNMNTGDTFGATWGSSTGDEPIWIFEDGTTVVGKTISQSSDSLGLDGTNQTVKIELIHDDLRESKQLIFNNLLIVGTLDLTPITDINNDLDFNFGNNPNMTDLLFADGSVTSNGFVFNNTGLTNPTFDGLEITGGSLVLRDCSNLQTLTFNELGSLTGEIECRSCPNLTLLDLSNILLVPNFRFIQGLNSGLQNILFRAGSEMGAVSSGGFLLFGSDITGVFDVSNVFGTFNNFNFTSNTSLTGFTFDEANTNLLGGVSCPNCDLGYVDFTQVKDYTSGNWSLQNNNMTVAEVNHYLVDLDNNSTDGTGQSFNISGSNAAPDSSSGGFDGDAAVLSLIAKNWTITTS